MHNLLRELFWGSKVRQQIEYLQYVMCYNSWDMWVRAMLRNFMCRVEIISLYNSYLSG